ncbi:MAG: flagellar biosynthesis protein FlgC [Pseudomonadota bacterium]|nr:flagellar biosynthesis protein FlgC [Pseudomonadota bacterium]
MSIVSNIAVSGLNDASRRIANAASNIVNASSTAALPSSASDPYTGFTPQDVVTLSDSVGGNNLGVSTTSAPRSPPYGVAYDPNSKLANAQGLVAVPNVDLASELVAANAAQTNYTADAAVIRIAQKTEKSLLDILR